MNEKVVFTYQLSPEQKEEWIAFLNKLGSFSRYQHPDWVELKKAPGKSCFFLFYKDSELVATSVIIENKFAANIDFGPSASSDDNYVKSVEHIFRYYKKKKVFGLLRITQPYLLSKKSERIEYAIFQKCSFSQTINSENWSSIGIDLTRSIDEIQGKFSTNHKRSIKKAIKLKTSIQEITTKKQVEEFTVVFDKMWKSRNLKNHYHDSAQKLWGMLEFFKTNDQGTMLGIYDENKTMIGGVILFFEGDRLYYDSGASNPEYRKIPMMHSIMNEMIHFGKDNGFKLLDLGGYNLLASAQDQTKHINRFKDGFGGHLLVYPKQMRFVLNRLVYVPFKLAIWVRNKFA